MVVAAVIGVMHSHVIIGDTRDLRLTLVEASSPPPCHYLQGQTEVGAHVAPALHCHRRGCMGVGARIGKAPPTHASSSGAHRGYSSCYPPPHCRCRVTGMGRGLHLASKGPPATTSSSSS